jgi:hypothetical protein
MRSTLRLACTLSFVFAAAPALAQQLDLPRPSPNAKISQMVGVTEIAVEYSSPAVKGRKIWGGLVPYGQVWRAGANNATKISFSKDVIVDGKPLPAGSYSFFVQPTATKWTLILNKEVNQSGTQYKKESDVMRVDVKPQPAPMRERLAYQVTNFTDSTASLDLEWEKVRVSLPVKLHTDEQVTANIKGLQNGGWSPWTQAARWELDQKNYDNGLALVEKSIGLKETWLNTFVKAQLLAGKGNYKEALPLAQKAKEMGDKEPESFFFKQDVENAIKAWKTKS